MILRSLKQRRPRRQRERQKCDRLYLQNNNFACASRFFCTFLSLISRFFEDGNTRKQLAFSFLELWYSPPELNYANIWRIKRDAWNKRDNVWGSANSLFKWRFRSRRSRCCLSCLFLTWTHTLLYCTSESTSGQDEVNPSFWLAYQAGKLGSSCPLGISHVGPSTKKFLFTGLFLPLVPEVFCLCEAKCFGVCRKRNPRAAKPGSLLRLDQDPKIV